MDISAILAPLRAAGLFLVYYMIGDKLHVQGGAREWEATEEPPIRGWEDPFVIFLEKSGKFTATVAGTRDRPQDAEQEFATLEEAVAFVLQVYASRPVPDGDHRVMFKE